MNSADIKENPAIGRNAVEFIDTLLTPEEIAESDFMVSLCEIKKAVLSDRSFYCIFHPIALFLESTKRRYIPSSFISSS